jgi:hypothetical protein
MKQPNRADVSNLHSFVRDEYQGVVCPSRFAQNTVCGISDDQTTHSDSARLTRATARVRPLFKINWGSSQSSERA